MRRRVSSSLNLSVDFDMPDKPSFPPKPKHYTNTYELIGRGISTWAVMEMRLVQIASKLMGTTESKAGFVLYSINSFYSWISIIDGLFDADDKFKSSKVKWSNLTSDLKTLNDIRVRLAHQAVYIGIYKSVEGDTIAIPEGLRPSPLDTRPKQRKLAPLSDDEIKDFSVAVTAIHERLATIITEMDGQNTSPETTA